MFANCSSLTTAPALPATTLVRYCYFEMFNNCSSLNKVTVKFTDWGTEYDVAGWLNGVSETGTFNHPTSLYVSDAKNVRTVTVMQEGDESTSRVVEYCRVPLSWNLTLEGTDSSSSDASSSSPTTIMGYKVSGSDNNLINGDYTDTGNTANGYPIYSNGKLYLGVVSANYGNS
jgi:hypothetical protein